MQGGAVFSGLFGVHISVGLYQLCDDVDVALRACDDERRAAALVRCIDLRATGQQDTDYV
jgi:hypothetical protein